MPRRTINPGRKDELTMKIGDRVETPRFMTVKINRIFENRIQAHEQGFKEPTHYQSDEYHIYGKTIGANTMIFAAVKK
jgi:hypothetical protein